MLHSFKKWIKLNEEQGPERFEGIEKRFSDEIGQGFANLDDIKQLAEIGVFDWSEIRQELQNQQSAFRKWLKGERLNPREEADLQILKELGERKSIVALKALASPGAQLLFDAGLKLVSSLAQLSRGNLIFSLDPAYTRSKGWGIGFFPELKTIRRMTPKTPSTHTYSWDRGRGSMDVPIKRYPSGTSEEEFFNLAFEWAANNIDFEHARAVQDPAEYKYYAKRTTRRFNK